MSNVIVHKHEVYSPTYEYVLPVDSQDLKNFPSWFDKFRGRISVSEFTDALSRRWPNPSNGFHAIYEWILRCEPVSLAYRDEDFWLVLKSDTCWIHIPPPAERPCKVFDNPSLQSFFHDVAGIELNFHFEYWYGFETWRNKHTIIERWKTEGDVPREWRQAVFFYRTPTNKGYALEQHGNVGRFNYDHANLDGDREVVHHAFDTVEDFAVAFVRAHECFEDNSPFYY